MATIDPERDEHLLEVGRAITQWASVEAQLFGIVLSVLKCTARQAAIVFYRTPTLEQRLQLTNDLLATVFPQPADNPGTHPHPGFTVWSSLQKELRAEMPVRNRLAHQPVELSADVWKHDTTGEITIGPLLFGTGISSAEALKKGRSDAALRVDDIKAHAARISGFPERLLAFRSGPLAAQVGVSG
jgi:hypothetical protein